MLVLVSSTLSTVFFPQKCFNFSTKEKKNRFRFLCYLHPLEKRSYIIEQEGAVGEYFTMKANC